MSIDELPYSESYYLDITEEEMQELPPILRRLAKKLAKKGIHVSRGSGTNIEHREDARGALGIKKISEAKFKINYGTLGFGDYSWDNYEDIGDQVVFFLKGLQKVEAVSYENGRGSPIRVELSV